MCVCALHLCVCSTHLCSICGSPWPPYEVRDAHGVDFADGETDGDVVLITQCLSMTGAMMKHHEQNNWGKKGSHHCSPLTEA